MGPPFRVRLRKICRVRSIRLVLNSFCAIKNPQMTSSNLPIFLFYS